MNGLAKTFLIGVALATSMAARDEGDGWAVTSSGAARREMSTDRPDATESPFTIEPGHMQIEMDLANFSRDREGGITTTTWEASPFNVRIGLTPAFEAGIFVTPFQSESETSGGLKLRRSGFGDPVLRAKWNFRGNDGKGVALGAIADVKLPVGERSVSNRQWEGAVMLPVAFSIGAGWEGAAMTGIEAVYTDAARHRAVWINTVTAGRELARNTSAFLELTSAAGDGSHVATFNTGVTRRFGSDRQLDAGVNVGLSRSAPDLLVFCGWSQRF